MEHSNQNDGVNTPSRIYKTPDYVRRATKKYYDKNKHDPDFIAKRKQAYLRNKMSVVGLPTAEQ